MFHRVLVLLWSLCCWGALAVNGEAADTVRLQGGAHRCEGAVEVKHRGEWRPLITSSIHDLWDLTAVSAVCLDLDCGSAVSAEERLDLNSSEAWRVSSECVKKKTAAVGDCVWDDRSDRDVGIKLVCSDSVRLVSGRSLCSGDLQIRDQFLNQSWTSVFEGELDRRGAEVLCRELGCGAPLLQGELSPLGRTFHCEGNESALMDCPRNQTRTDPETSSGHTLHLTCSEPVRLVGGITRCEGTVQLKQSEWRDVLPASLQDRWHLEAAAAVCRDLDCGSAVSTRVREGDHRRNVWRVTSDCVKKSALRDCSFSVHGAFPFFMEVVCSDSVRLVSGRSLCSGSLEIRDQSSDWSWTSVCEGALDHRDAEVVCRELDCGAPLLQGELSPLGQMFHCEGHESALMDCPRNQTWTDPGTCSTLNLTCSDPLRLVGGAGRCEGTVEGKYREEWRRVTTFDTWDLEHAAAVCRSLDCGSAVSTERKEGFGSSAVWAVKPVCVKTAPVRECVWGDIPDCDNGLEVVCSAKA